MADSSEPPAGGRAPSPDSHTIAAEHIPIDITVTEEDDTSPVSSHDAQPAASGYQSAAAPDAGHARPRPPKPPKKRHVVTVKLSSAAPAGKKVMVRFLYETFLNGSPVDCTTVLNVRRCSPERQVAAGSDICQDVVRPRATLRAPVTVRVTASRGGVDQATEFIVHPRPSR